MLTSRLAKSIGAGAIMLAGFTSLAFAGSPEYHVMNVQLPDGRIQQIRYTGDMPPAVVIAPVESPFAAMDRMMAAMDRQMNAMMRLASMPLSAPFPGGVAGPVTVSAGSGICMRSVQVTYTGNGQPQVVSQTSGDCGPASVPATLPNAPADHAAPRTIEVKAEPGRPVAAQRLVQTISDSRG